MSTVKASVVEEYKTSAEFANIIDEEFLKSAAKIKEIMESHYPNLTIVFWRMIKTMINPGMVAFSSLLVYSLLLFFLFLFFFYMYQS